MKAPHVATYPPCSRCKALDHDACTGCTGCGCTRSAQWSAALAEQIAGGKS